MVTKNDLERFKNATQFKQTPKQNDAKWDEFDLKDVNTTIEFTEELILKHIDK